MRLLFDENVPRSFVEELATRGHSVVRIQELASGAPDEVVLREAVRSDAVLITLDSDFGTLVFVHGEPPPPGIVLIRLGPATLMEQAPAIANAIETAMADRGTFLVVGRDGLRIRPISSNS